MNLSSKIKVIKQRNKTLKNPLVYQDAAFGGVEEMTKFQLLDPIQNSELPPYHRIHCVSNLTCQGL